jgi:hypothetical protein
MPRRVFGSERSELDPYGGLRGERGDDRRRQHASEDSKSHAKLHWGLTSLAAMLFRP